MLVPPIPVGANQLRFPDVLSLTVTAQVYVPSLFCEQLLEVGSILTGATCITGVGVGDGDGDGDSEGVGVLPESNVSVTGMVTVPPFE